MTVWSVVPLENGEPYLVGRSLLVATKLTSHRRLRLLEAGRNLGAKPEA